MNAPLNLIDAIHHHRTVCEYTSRRLCAIADALYVLGNDRLAADLEDIAAPLLPSAKAISEAHGLELSGQLRHSEHMAAMLLKATIAGVLGPRTEGSK